MKFPYKLREWQSEAIKDLRQFVSSDAKHAVLLQDCGEGKESVMANIILEWVEKGNKAIWLTARSGSGEWNKRKELEAFLKKNPKLKPIIVFLRSKQDLCPFKKEWEEKTGKKVKSAIEFCSVAKPKCPYKSDFIRQDIMLSNVISLVDEKIVPDGFCPYYYLRHALTKADITICDYNYVIHPIIRSVITKKYPAFINRKTLILFDECHLLPDRARNNLRTQLTMRTLENVKNEVEGKFLFSHPNPKKLMKELEENTRRYRKEALEGIAWIKNKLKLLSELKSMELKQEYKQSEQEKAKISYYDFFDSKIKESMKPLERIGYIIQRFKFKHEIGTMSWTLRVAQFLKTFDTFQDRKWILHVLGIRHTKKGKTYPYLTINSLDPYITVAKALKQTGKTIFYSGTLYVKNFTKIFRLKNSTILSDYPKTFPSETRMDIFTRDGRITYNYYKQPENAKVIAGYIRAWREKTKNCRSYVVTTNTIWRCVEPYLKKLGIKTLSIPTNIPKTLRKATIQKLTSQKTKCLNISPYSWASHSQDFRNITAILVIGIPVSKLTLEKRAVIDYYMRTFTKEPDAYVASWMFMAIIPAIQQAIQATERARIFSKNDFVSRVWIDKRYLKHWRYVKAIGRLENVEITETPKEAFDTLEQQLKST